MRKSIIFVLTVLLPLLAFAQGHIRYSGDPLPIKSVEAVEQMMDYMYEFYAGIGLRENFVVELRTFKEQKEGYKFMRQLYPDKPEYQVHPKDKTYGGSIGGIYIPKQKMSIILGMEHGADKALGLIYHELSHHYTRSVFAKRNPPIWLNEGLAEHFQSLKKTKNGFIPVFPEYIKGKIRTMYMLGELDLVNFFDLSQTEFYKIHRQEGQYYYGLSHAVVATLMQNLPSEKFSYLVNCIVERDTSQKLSGFVENIYPGGIEALEKDLLDFVQR